MNKSELFVVLIIILIISTMNIISHTRKENLKRNYALIIEQGTIQISINEMERHVLEELPGIGPILAERIIEYRRRNGRFENLEELKNVKGIGEKLYQKILPYIKL